jgi:hypothetical protein
MKSLSENKKGAMEMSVGTIVTIVLLMSVLILGIFLVQKIFKTSTTAIDGIDSQVQSQINELFSDENKAVVVFPTSREISLEKDSTGGFGFSILNKDTSAGDFTYRIDVMEISPDCEITKEEAESLIILGKESLSPITLPSGSFLENAIFVKLKISEFTPLCNIRYGINVLKEGEQYAPTIGVDVEIIS